MSDFNAPYEPSPWEPIANEVALYESTQGKEPSQLVGDQWVILWTVGSKSGSVRKTPLVRTTDDQGNYAVIGSMGGAPNNPQWVHNLRSNKLARIQDGAAVTDLGVREVAGEEKQLWWNRALAVWPQYDSYQAATDREIPVFVLEPKESD